jgi:hypothetical protein
MIAGRGKARKVVVKREERKNSRQGILLTTNVQRAWFKGTWDRLISDVPSLNEYTRYVMYGYCWDINNARVRTCDSYTDMSPAIKDMNVH